MFRKLLRKIWGKFGNNSLEIARQFKVILFDTRAYVYNLDKNERDTVIRGNAKMMIERNNAWRDEMQTVTN